jgi:hypothetical protein
MIKEFHDCVVINMMINVWLEEVNDMVAYD